MGFRPVAAHLGPRLTAHDAFVQAATNATNQLVASFTGAGTAEAFRRGVNYALIRLEASAPVSLLAPSIDDAPSGLAPASWIAAISLASYSGDHVPLIFPDGIQISAGAGVIVNAFVAAIPSM